MRSVPPASILNDAELSRALEVLRAAVRERGLRGSSVREAIARVALQQVGHFTVEELVGSVRDAGDSEVHAATVYRVLPLLVEAGLLQMTLVSSGDGARYERAFGREHHDHLICTRCGKVVEFEFEAIEVLQRDVAERFGFHLLGHVHELLGMCADCATAPSA